MTSATQAWIRALKNVKQNQHQPLPAVISNLAETYGDRPALFGEDDEVLSYRQLAERIDRCARWALANDLQNQVVALLMPNCPEYVAIWLGLTRVGCTVALLNTNLRPDALVHSLLIVRASSIIVDRRIEFDLELNRLGILTYLWPPSSSSPAPDISADRLVAWPQPRLLDDALLIYTSGTTGLPKAVHIAHRRIIEWSYWFKGLMDASPADRLYNCLPMYHSIGGVVAIGSMLVAGGSVVVRQRFSASRFWPDVVATESTIFQYIGELCRYLVQTTAQPESPHHLRLAVGNGLQRDVWETFQNRFTIPQILEFYAATEGGVSLYNCEGKPGAIGRIPPFLATSFAVAIVQCDLETGEPVRTAEGFCLACGPDETGEAIGQISADRRFDGYTNPVASEKKILKNVFTESDRWFRTGDLMRRDRQGYYYFIDRIGDTYRWKGENVSTTEVANVIRHCPGVIDAVVYGVTMPGQEGRAGMAAILVDDEKFDLDTLRSHLSQCLPPYARPLYVRLCESLNITGTFKLSKTQLIADGQQGGDDLVWVL